MSSSPITPAGALNQISDGANRWQRELAALSYAYGQPEVSGYVKSTPQDFCVTELMEVEPSGEGEHYWLDITKTRLNTDSVAKELARFAGVAYRDVGYSGLKDFYAVTRQWFSVWVPQPHKRSSLKWSEFELSGTEVHLVKQHERKIKRGTHRANRFDITVRQLLGSGSVTAVLEERLVKVRQQGVPNYFGEQRFGRNAGNMQQAYDMLLGKKRIKSRALRGLLLSSARSWMFNHVVSKRVSDGSWTKLTENEPANLNGSKSYFLSGDAGETTQELERRLQALDIHPTAPMWGQGGDEVMRDCPELGAWERETLQTYQDLCSSLVAARVEYQRRPLRIALQSLEWSFEGENLNMNFQLPLGQFATSVLREIVADHQQIQNSAAATKN